MVKPQSMNNCKPIVSPYKCVAHRMWMRKGVCELCRLEADKKQQEQEKEMGVQKQEVVIKRV